MSLDQWTPATVAAAQANRPRSYHRDGGSAGNLGWIYRYQLQGSAFENGVPGAMANYVSGSLNRATARGWTSDTWGRVVQTFRQAVARIVRRAKWRRIIRALRMQRRLGDYFERSRPLAGPRRVPYVDPTGDTYSSISHPFYRLPPPQKTYAD